MIRVVHLENRNRQRGRIRHQRSQESDYTLAVNREVADIYSGLTLNIKAIIE